MKLSLNWLNDYMDTGVIKDAQEFCDKLTDSGSKVESFDVLASDIDNVVVGKILSVEKHPNADKLVVCQIDVGQYGSRQIVTGARNVSAGDLVPVCLDGAHLPGGVVIKSGKLRGELSEGMLCSIAELGLTLHDMPDAIEDGILILHEDCKPGDDIKKVLMLEDTVVDFEITSNRQDCFSVIGLAREAAATYKVPVKINTPPATTVGGEVDDYIKVSVEAPDLCRRYIARAVRNVRIGTSPMWFRRRLRAMGIRPISNIVDITNYVMCEYGQPMHAFDRSYLEGGQIIVRRAKDGEKITTLDGVERNIDESMLMICDSVKPCCVAGVMGGLNSEINDATTEVIFESACFSGTSVRLTAKALGMRTESSGLFEKGLDPENAMDAVNRACELVELLGCGEVVPGAVDVYSDKPEQKKVRFEPERINSFIGIDVPEAEQREILERLHFTIKDGYVYAPSFRTDISCFADVAEEVARMHGYNSIKPTGMSLSGGYNEKQKFINMLHDSCVAMGLQEIMTYSFISPKTYDLMCLPADSEMRRSVVISNPLGEDTGVMRTTAAGSMLEVLSHNRSYRNPSVAFYEMARVFIPHESADEQPDEKQRLVIGFYEKGDFYTIKGMCENLAEIVFGRSGKAQPNYEIEAHRAPVFHPGRCAALYHDKKRYMVFGEVHPDVLKNYDLSVKAYLAVIDVDELFEVKNTEKTYRALPKYQATARDLSFVCDKALTVGELEKKIISLAGKRLEAIKLFDIYEGEQIGADKKSVSFTLTIRDREKTLTDQETDAIIAKVVRGVEKEFNAPLRA